MESGHPLSFKGDSFNKTLWLITIHLAVLPNTQAVEAGGLPRHHQRTDIPDQILEDHRQEMAFLLNAELVPFTHLLLTTDIRGGDEAVERFRIERFCPFLRRL